MFNGGVERDARAGGGAARAADRRSRSRSPSPSTSCATSRSSTSTAPGCSKGSTLARWAAARGVAREEVMAVGDNLNDLEMLEFAGTAVRHGQRARR